MHTFRKPPTQPRERRRLGALAAQQCSFRRVFFLRRKDISPGLRKYHVHVLLGYNVGLGGNETIQN